MASYAPIVPMTINWCFRTIWPAYLRLWRLCALRPFVRVHSAVRAPLPDLCDRGRRGDLSEDIGAGLVVGTDSQRLERLDAVNERDRPDAGRRPGNHVEQSLPALREQSLVERPRGLIERARVAHGRREEGQRGQEKQRALP